TRTRRRGWVSVSRTCSTPRSCGKRSRSHSPRRTSGSSASTAFLRSTSRASPESSRRTRSESGPTSAIRPCSSIVRCRMAARCCWLDLVALAYAVRLNGITSLALTKLDVLSNFAELPVCVAYQLRDGSETDEFPAHQSDFHHCRPVYETLRGWQEPLTDGLPEAARAYVDFVEHQLGVEISLVGTGAERERVVALGS